MTFKKAPYAIDGPTTGAGLARTAVYDGSEGIINKGDLKVTQLGTPGNGLLIAAGAAVLLNRAQGSAINESYTAVNVGTHTVSSGSMPASNALAKEYLVLLTVGDPEYYSGSHPWLQASDVTPGQEDTFDYVRPFIYGPVTAGATVDSLNLAFPCIALARLNIPSSTTTITNAMLTDMRELARPRSKLATSKIDAGGTNTLIGTGGVAGTYERWPNAGILTIKVPTWAVKAKVFGFVEGAKLLKAGNNKLRVYIEGTALVSTITNVGEQAPGASGDRRGYNILGEIDVTSIQGQTVTFSIQGSPNTTGDKSSLSTDTATSAAIQVYFEEQPT